MLVNEELWCEISKLLEVIKEEDFITLLCSVNLITNDLLNKDKIPVHDLYKKPFKHNELNHFIDGLYELNYEGLASELLTQLGLFDFYQKLKASAHIPRAPINYVQRTALVHKIKQTICSMDRNTTMVISGAIGIGKSCQLSQAIDFELVKNCHIKEIIWIDCRDPEIDGDPLKILQKFYNKISLDYTDLRQMQKSEVSIEELKNNCERILREIEPPLLVLDNLDDPELYKNFDIRCKTMITTHCEKILNHHHLHIKVDNGFSEAESLKMFVNALGKLNFKVEAKHIHQLCNGHPTVMAVISSYLKDNQEEALNHDDLWRKIMKSLKNHSYEMFGINNEFKNINRSIEVSVKKLPSEAQRLYKLFTIFQPNIAVSSKLLEIFFGMNYFEVKNLINELKNHSLIDVSFDIVSKSYECLLNIFQYNYLKPYNCVKHIHQTFVNKYFLYIKNDLKKITDPYILQYLSYHWKDYKAFNKFSDLLNLDFIERKIRVLGPKWVLDEIKLYENEIIWRNPDFEGIFKDLKKFIEEYGFDIYHYPESTIYQYALFLDLDNEVYKLAIKYVINNAGKLFFKLRYGSERDVLSCSLKIQSDITHICVIKINAILFGTNNGQIGLWYCNKFYWVHSHTSGIINLSISRDHNFFVSRCENKLIIWKLLLDLDDTPFFNEANILMDIPGRSIRCTVFSNDNSHIAIAYEDGKVKIWNLRSKQLLETLNLSEKTPIKSLTFIANNTMLAFILNTDITMYSCNLSENGCDFNYIYTIKSLIQPSLLLSINWDFFIICIRKIYKLSHIFQASCIELYESEKDIKDAKLSTLPHLILLYEKSLNILNFNNGNVLKKINLDSVIMDYCINDGKYNIFTITQNHLQRNTVILDQMDPIRFHNLDCNSHYWKDNESCIFVTHNANTLQIHKDSKISSLSLEINNLESIHFSSDFEYLLLATPVSVYKMKISSTLTDNLIICPAPWNLLNNQDSFSQNLLNIKGNTKFRILTQSGLPINNSETQLADVFNFSNYVLTVSNNGYINLFDLTKLRGTCSQVSNEALTQICFNRAKRFLAIAYTNAGCNRMNLYDCNNSITLRFTCSYIDKINSMSIKDDGTFLGIGFQNGTIKILNLDDYSYIHLKVNNHPIESLIFPEISEPILVSLSDHIVFWDLKQFNGSDTICNDFSTDLNSSRLLSCIKLYGRTVKFITISKDFSCFFAVDNDGRHYMMDRVF